MAEQKEILESIRDIISGKPGEDDVLDLTKKLNEDGSVTEITPATPTAASNDVLKDIDSMLNQPKAPIDKDVELAFEPKPEKFEIAEEFAAADAIAPYARAHDEQSRQRAASGAIPSEKQSDARGIINKLQKDNTMDSLDAIISGDSATAAKASISELTGHLKGQGREANKVEPGAPFRNGETVEDLVAEMLRPMMKDWLDKNLPKLVNEIVQKEIQKLIPRD